MRASVRHGIDQAALNARIAEPNREHCVLDMKQRMTLRKLVQIFRHVWINIVFVVMPKNASRPALAPDHLKSVLGIGAQGFGVVPAVDEDKIHRLIEPAEIVGSGIASYLVNALGGGSAGKRKLIFLRQLKMGLGKRRVFGVLLDRCLRVDVERKNFAGGIEREVVGRRSLKRAKLAEGRRLAFNLTESLDMILKGLSQ